ncbi:MULTISPECIES: M48 family metalloprotease [unclassified Ectothiorhodospira]|uniref:M48 family metalloprotease n=1 Tax=unclassified Ectothiorhodospira TaxID=2684909 RepID=UPI001EE819E7|nr:MULTISPECIES: M48 family metalloprotease [unclassified Ectothiorhodospira]MCG5515857.1 M48 family metalloprotease [Ectothiorhodospira sp. 9100]MCG5518803.1 M48 family metalloprotease [Ectothiorhodospira sp. 9905]
MGKPKFHGRLFVVPGTGQVGNTTRGATPSRRERVAPASRLWARLITALLCLTLLWPVHAPAQVSLPEIGAPSSAMLSPSQEQQLGRSLLREVRRNLPLSEDPQLLGYAEAVGQRLVSSAPDGHPNFTFLVVEDDGINAFAMPGGIVGVNTGLIEATRNEAELAAVLAHEIAHVTQRHIARAYAGSTRIDLAAGLAILAGIIASAYVPELGQAAIVGGMAGSAQARINFTRANEQEADRIGISILAATDFDPQAMPTFFERLMQLSGGLAEAVPEYLRTHPVTSSRISDSRVRANQYEGEYRSDSQEFRLIRTRIQALKDPARMMDLHERRTDSEAPSPEQLYGYALARNERGQRDQALATLDRIDTADNESLALYVELGRAEIHMEGRNPDHAEALHILERLHDIYPGYLPVAQTYAKALLDAGHHDQAIQVLDRLLEADHPPPELLRLRADAATRANRQAISHESMAEYYFHHGQYREAVRQLDRALTAPDLTPHQEARIRSKRDIAIRFTED